MSTNYCDTIEKLPNGKTMPLRDLLGPLPADLELLAKKLKARFTKLTAHNSQGHYQIGEMLKREIPKIEGELEKSGKTHYGSHLIRHLGMKLNIHPRVLHNCLRAAERFTPEQYESRIIKNGLTWTHASLLSQLHDSPERDSLIDQTVAEKLSIDELAALIVVPKKSRGPGRGPAVPRNLPQALSRLQKLSKSYCNTLESVLFGDKYDLPSEIKTTPPDQLTGEIRDFVADCSAQLALIEKTAQDASKRLQVSLEHIDKIIIAQKAFQESTPSDDDAAHAQKPQRQLACAS